MKCFRLLILLCLCLGLSCACAPENAGEGVQLDVSNPEEGVLTAAELIRFFESGSSQTVRLASNIDLGNGMLKLSGSRGSVTIEGNGYSITSTGDSVIRLDDGCSLTLKDLTITAGACGIGCMEDARISGENLRISAIADGIQCAGDLVIGAESHISIDAAKGNGIEAKSLDIEAGSYLVCSGGQGAIDVTKNDLTMEENVYLSATTQENYNALKCWGDLTLRDGSSLYVENMGEYHGAEINTLHVEGVVSIMAKGGEKGVGLFLFELTEEYKVLGYCEPALRFESGRGALNFVADASEILKETPEGSGS